MTDTALLADGTGNSKSDQILDWFPIVKTADSANLPQRNKLTGRARELDRTNPHARAGRVRARDNIIGPRLQLDYSPNWKALGIEPNPEFKAMVTAKWVSYAFGQRCLIDAARQQHFGMLLETGFNHYWTDGQCLIVEQWRENPFGPATCFQITDPERLQTPTGKSHDTNIRGGVELHPSFGEPIAYHIRKAHPSDARFGGVKDAHEFERVPRYTSWGRQKVIHYYDKEWAGQSIGRSRLAAGVERLKLVDTYGLTHVQAAILDTIMGLFIQSAMDPELMEAFTGGDDQPSIVSEYQSTRQAYLKQNSIGLGSVAAHMMFPGDTINTVKSERPSPNFSDFEAAQLRAVASSLGISYEQLTADWSKVNYSSARAAANEIWRTYWRERAHFGFAVASPMFALWFEEMVMVGAIALPEGAPEFAPTTRDDWVKCDWIGPARGHVDPDKETKADAREIRETGTKSVTQTMRERGRDIEDHVAELSEEKRIFNAAGFKHPMEMEQTTAANGARIADDRAEPEDEGEGETE